MSILRTDKIAGLESVNAITGSVNFPNDGATGTGDYLRVDRKDNSDYNLSTNDFTIEFWFNSRNVGSTLHTLTFAASTVSASSDVGFYIRFNGGVINAYCFQSTNTIGGVSTGSVSMNTWYHVAYVRNGSTFTVYLDGTAAASASSTATVNYDAGWNLNIGSAYTNTYHYNGYLSNVRIVNGKALYTSNFTAPTRQLEVTPETVLLCCHSSQDPTQEATGKTLTAIRTDNFSGPLVSSFIPDVGNDHTHGTVLEGGTAFSSLNYMTLPRGTTTQSNRGRGVFAGGETPSKVNSIEYVNIQSMGTAKDFGDLTTVTGDLKGLGSSTRGVFRVDNNPTSRNVLEYITFATTSNSTDFGDLNVAVQQRPGASNQTRGIFSGGLYPGSSVHNDMDYITIASTGNAADFGNLSVARGDTSALANSTRMIVGGGWTPGPTYSDVIDYVTIATTGDAADFGDLNTGKRSGTAVANSTRGVFGPGKAPSVSNVIDYVTIATTGTVTDFGDASVARGGAGSASNSIRGLFAGGYTPTIINGIEFITIASTGNGADFGDMTFVSQYGGGCSDSHGGLT